MAEDPVPRMLVNDDGSPFDGIPSHAQMAALHEGVNSTDPDKKRFDIQLVELVNAVLGPRCHSAYTRYIGEVRAREEARREREREALRREQERQPRDVGDDDYERIHAMYEERRLAAGDDYREPHEAAPLPVLARDRDDHPIYYPRHGDLGAPRGRRPDPGMKDGRPYSSCEIQVEVQEVSEHESSLLFLCRYTVFAIYGTAGRTSREVIHTLPQMHQLISVEHPSYGDTRVAFEPIVYRDMGNLLDCRLSGHAVQFAERVPDESVLKRCIDSVDHSRYELYRVIERQRDLAGRRVATRVQYRHFVRKILSTGESGGSIELAFDTHYVDNTGTRVDHIFSDICAGGGDLVFVFAQRAFDVVSAQDQGSCILAVDFAVMRQVTVTGVSRLPRESRISPNGTYRLADTISLPHTRVYPATNRKQQILAYVGDCGVVVSAYSYDRTWRPDPRDKRWQRYTYSVSSAELPGQNRRGLINFNARGPPLTYVMSPSMVQRLHFLPSGVLLIGGVERRFRPAPPPPPPPPPSAEPPSDNNAALYAVPLDEPVSRNRIIGIDVIVAAIAAVRDTLSVVSSKRWIGTTERTVAGSPTIRLVLADEGWAFITNGDGAGYTFNAVARSATLAVRKYGSSFTGAIHAFLNANPRRRPFVGVDEVRTDGDAVASALKHVRREGDADVHGGARDGDGDVRMRE